MRRLGNPFRIAQLMWNSGSTAQFANLCTCPSNNNYRPSCINAFCSEMCWCSIWTKLKGSSTASHYQIRCIVGFSPQCTSTFEIWPCLVCCKRIHRLMLLPSDCPYFLDSWLQITGFSNWVLFSVMLPLILVQRTSTQLILYICVCWVKKTGEFAGCCFGSATV